MKSGVSFDLWFSRVVEKHMLCGGSLIRKEERGVIGGVKG